MEYKVGDCFTYIRNGANIKQDKLAGGIPITRIETLSNDTFNRDKMGYAGIQNYEKYKSYLLQDGDILMSHINSARFLGRAVVYHKEGHEKIIHGMNLLLLKARLDIINPEYAVLVFKSEIFKRALQKIIKKSVNQASFAVSDLKKLKIEVPVLSEQEKIVEEFYKLNRILKSRTKELNTFDELVKARFVEMFSEEKYPHQTIDELCTAIVDCPHSTPTYEGYLINPCIRTSEIKKGYISWDTMKYVSDEEYKERTTRLKPLPGDIVYGREGSFGNAAILPKGNKFCLGQRVMLLRPNYRICTSEYMLHAIISDEVYQQAIRMNNASTVAHVNVKDVKRFIIPVPPIAMQNEYALLVQQITKSKVAIQKSLDETQTLMDSLMQKYFG